MADTVVVGVDGSKDSGRALAWAAGEAALRGVPLRIVFGLHMPVAGVPFSGAATLPPSAELEKRVQAILDAAARLAREAQPDIETETAVIRKPPADALLKESEAAGLVVVGTRGMGSIRSAFLGSVPVRLAAHAKSPVAIVPDTSTLPSPDGPVTVAVDGSPQGVAATEVAYAEARRRGVTLVAMHACKERAQEHGEEILTSVLDLTQANTPNSVTVDKRVVTDEDAPTAVLRAAPDTAVFVVGSRGRGTISGVVLGSTSQALLRRAEEPVIVVHAP